MGTQLIMTIGTNALPIWVAWHHLKDKLGESVALRFIHTDQTETEKKLLEKRIRSECPGTTILPAIPIKPGEPKAIRKAIQDNVISSRPEECTHFHLHYTGGAKSMGVETVSIIEKEMVSDPDTTVNASYLNPRGSRGPEIVSRTSLHVSDTREGINIDLKSIAELNGIKFTQQPLTPTPDQLNRGMQWLDDNWPDPPNYRAAGENTGFVLEYGVYAAFKKALEDKGRKHWQLYRGMEARRVPRQGRRSNPNPFELDVVAVLGYQIVLVSCAILTKASPIKIKAMEGIIRAKQLGGEEAHCITVCKATNPSCDSIQAGLEDEMGDDNPHLRIWGETNRDRLPDFKGLTSKFKSYLKDISW